jgi:hypothetical protein
MVVTWESAQSPPAGVGVDELILNGGFELIYLYETYYYDGKPYPKYLPYFWDCWQPWFIYFKYLSTDAYSGNYALYLVTYHDHFAYYHAWADQTIGYHSDVPLKMRLLVKGGGWLPAGNIVVSIWLDGVEHSVIAPLEELGVWRMLEIDVPAGTVEKVRLDVSPSWKEDVEWFYVVIDEVHLNPVR